MIEQRRTTRRDDGGGRPQPVRELTQSLILLAFVASSLSVYVGLGFAAVRLLAGR